MVQYKCTNISRNKKSYIIKCNFKYFGKKNLNDQEIIKEKLIKAEGEFQDYLKLIIKKYSMRTLLFELGNIYSKLLDISLNNDKILLEKRNIEIDDISYASRASTLMSRKLKTAMETVIIENNKSGKFYLTNSDYKMFIVLLQYHSIYIFYNSRTNLSKSFENGITEFAIFPNELDSIVTFIKGSKESDTDVHYNYEPKEEFKIGEKFNKVFLSDKGILFEDYINLLDNLIKYLKIKKKNSMIFNAELFQEYLQKNFLDIDLNKFLKHCILKSDSFEYDKDNIYKNTCKHRLDTVPIIQLDESHYFMNRGILENSKQFWCNVQYLGLTPYTFPNIKNDVILKEVNVIVERITTKFENDIVEKLKEIYPEIIYFQNRKTKHIFKEKKLDDNEWDIIAINHDKKYIFDIEAKYVTSSMTESSLASDLEKFVGKNRNYQEKFEKRINIENENINDFLSFCGANNEYKVIHIMVTSKHIDLDVNLDKRRFAVISFRKLKEYISKYY